MGVSAAAEIAGRAVIGNGLATQMRPRKYWTIPKESLERLLDDVEQLINFFVIEFQRILFVENIYVTIAVSSTKELLRITNRAADLYRHSSHRSSPTSSSSSCQSGVSP